jgi:hypothetical protein
MNMSDTEILKRKKKPKYKLEDLDVFEVSLVSKPAIGVKYIMTKSAESPVLSGVAEDDSSSVETETVEVEETSTEETVPMNEKLQELLKGAELELTDEQIAALDAMFAMKEAGLTEELMLGIYKEAGYEVPTETVEVEVKVEVPVEVEKSEESTEEPEVETDSQEEVLKGLSDAQVALFKEQEDKLRIAKEAAEKAHEIAVAERDARKEREFVAKAAEYNELPYKAEEFGPVLRAIEDNLDEATQEIIKGVFKSAQEAILASKQLEELGQPGSEEGEADWVSRVAKMVESGEYNRGDAIEHLMRTEPKLFY